MEELPCRAYDGSVERLFSDLSRDGLYGALLGVAARQRASGSTLSAVGQEFWNAGYGRRCCGSWNFIFIKHLPDLTEDSPFAFTACHGHDRLLCRVQKRRQVPFQETRPFFRAWNVDSRRTESSRFFTR